MELTPPGQLLRRDFRPPGRLPLAGPTNTISLVQWNIERGYELEGIIEALRRLNADVIALQEVDVGCDRSGGADTGGCSLPAAPATLARQPQFRWSHRC
jgi:hypothetical protein